MAGGIEYSDIQLGMIVLPKTANPEHMKSNAAVDFFISLNCNFKLKAKRFYELSLAKNKLLSIGRFRRGEAIFSR
jgi:diketogulonate reductase-like aldo/keto reductase